VHYLQLYGDTAKAATALTDGSPTGEHLVASHAPPIFSRHARADARAALDWQQRRPAAVAPYFAGDPTAVPCSDRLP
jgi:hypothetical protein